MKKIAALLLAVLMLTLAFAQTALAGVVTTEAQRSTAATTHTAYENDVERGQDIAIPIIICLIIVCACIIYGIAELRKHKDDTL